MNHRNLREGNYINFFDAEVNEWYGIRINSNDDIYAIEKCPEVFKPLQLNENYLEQLSFNVSYNNSGKKYFERDGFKFISLLDVLFRENVGNIEFRYMHELQNLFFDRKGFMIDFQS